MITATNIKTDNHENPVVFSSVVVVVVGEVSVESDGSSVVQLWEVVVEDGSCSVVEEVSV